jgi:hypothetical protein
MSTVRVDVSPSINSGPLTTLAFLVMVMIPSHRTHTKPWKSSALAMVFHGLDWRAEASFRTMGGLAEQTTQAVDVRVRLSDDNNVDELRRT